MIEQVVSELGKIVRSGGPEGAPRLQLTGLKGASKALAVAEWLREGRSAIVVLPTEREAEAFHRDLSFFLGVEDIDAPAALGAFADLVRFAADDFAPYEAASPDPDDAAGRVEGLYRLAHADRPVAVVTSARGLARRTIPRASLERAVELVQAGEDLDRDRFLLFLAAAGYSRVSVVEDRGTFAVRGAILDVWPPLQPRPVRIELFGDNVESIKRFDVSSQRSRDPLEELVVAPVREVFFGGPEIRAAKRALEPLGDKAAADAISAIERKFAFSGIESLIPWIYAEEDGSPVLETALDYLPERAGLFRFDPLGIEREMSALTAEVAIEHARARADKRPAPDPALLFADHAMLFGSRATIDVSDVELAGGALVRVPSESTASLRAEIQAAATASPDTLLEPLSKRLRVWQGDKTKVVFVAHSPSQGERLLFLLSKYRINMQLDERDHPGVDLVDSKSPLRASPEEVTVVLGEISAGFVLPSGNLCVISETEVFGERAHRRRAKQFADADAIKAISDLKTGDVVVHKDYGIGTFKGIKRVESTEAARAQLDWLPGSGTTYSAPPVDFVHLEYAGGDKLYVPVYKMSLVQKYTAGEGETITLDKLGGTGWESRKKKVSVAVARMAQELLDLYARREVARRPPIGLHPEMAAFEARFEYEETADQLAAIDKIHDDLSGERPMDRLVCGDVGYGKTEVALRAAARVALDGRQVAVLVPTTILAQQHGRTFEKRFRDTPVVVKTLSRFQTPQESKEVIAGLIEGKVDIVIGTHRLLSKEIKFRDLGLIVIDEEHRFGVSHKEKLKDLRAHVDVLTLSATPIPRTLHMAMSGLRDLSLIETPPEDRLPIRTFVAKWEGAVIREAVMRELARGGQIYFVHNRVHNIGALASFVQKCVPEARVGIAHGQMAPDDLEKMMLDFVDRKYDVLVSTAIVESGLDIPSANTMIINRADRFGLAQLYQLRGRVGRGATRAYCVMLIPPGDGVVSADALERLSAMQEYTELGSGFRVAQRDLEIRGAGNLLGTNQSGFIQAVGFDLYVTLLRKEVDKLRGQEPEIELEPEINLKVAALIPDGYVQDARFRVGFYRRLSSAKDEDELGAVRDELRDRYGVLPGEVDNLVDVLRIRRSLQKLGIKDLAFDGKELVLTFADRTKVNPERLVRMVTKEPKRYRLTPDQKFRVRVPDRDKAISEAKSLLALLQ